MIDGKVAVEEAAATSSVCMDELKAKVKETLCKPGADKVVYTARA